MSRILWALVCTLFALGCHDDTCKPEYGCYPPLTEGETRDYYSVTHLVSEWVVDPSLTADEVQTLLEAAEAWETATAGRVTMSFTVAAEPLPERMVVRRTVESDDADPKWLASYGARQLRIREGIETRWLKPVLVHELGHFLGLGHEPNKNSIMYPRIREGMPTEPTADAIADLSELYSW